MNCNEYITTRITRISDIYIYIKTFIFQYLRKLDGNLTNIKTYFEIIINQNYTKLNYIEIIIK